MVFISKCRSAVITKVKLRHDSTVTFAFISEKKPFPCKPSISSKSKKSRTGRSRSTRNLPIPPEATTTTPVVKMPPCFRFLFLDPFFRLYPFFCSLPRSLKNVIQYPLFPELPRHVDRYYCSNFNNLKYNLTLYYRTDLQCSECKYCMLKNNRTLKMAFNTNASLFVCA